MRVLPSGAAQSRASSGDKERNGTPQSMRHLEPVGPRLARNAVIKSTFDVGRRRQLPG